MTKTFEGFVHKRSKVRGYEFPFETKYEFTALIFNQDLVGYKFNIPADFNTVVKVGDRVRITMENPMMNKGFFILRGGDKVKSMGVSIITDPTKVMEFFAGYISLPSNNQAVIHKPQDPKGVNGNIALVIVPFDLIRYNHPDMMCCTWRVEGTQIVDRINVTRILETIPKTIVKTWEEPLKRVWFSIQGMIIKRMGESLFIPSEVLSFNCSEDLNHIKKDLLGTIRVTMGYRMTCRWNTRMNDEERRWVPTVPEKIEFTDRSSVHLLQRYGGKK